MKPETLNDLIDWTQRLHHALGQCLREGIDGPQGRRAHWLLEYLADHETQLEEIVQGFARDADRNALNTWVYDYFTQRPLQFLDEGATPFSGMDVEEICQTVFNWHNQIIDLYRYLEGRADIPEVRELVSNLLEIETHEMMKLAYQSSQAEDI